MSTENTTPTQPVLDSLIGIWIYPLTPPPTTATAAPTTSPFTDAPAAAATAASKPPPVNSWTFAIYNSSPAAGQTKGYSISAISNYSPWTIEPTALTPNPDGLILLANEVATVANPNLATGAAAGIPINILVTYSNVNNEERLIVAFTTATGTEVFGCERAVSFKLPQSLLTPLSSLMPSMTSLAQTANANFQKSENRYRINGDEVLILLILIVAAIGFALVKQQQQPQPPQPMYGGGYSSPYAISI